MMMHVLESEHDRQPIRLFSIWNWAFRKGSKEGKLPNWDIFGYCALNHSPIWAAAQIFLPHLVSEHLQLPFVSQIAATFLTVSISYPSVSSVHHLGEENVGKGRFSSS